MGDGKFYLELAMVCEEVKQRTCEHNDAKTSCSKQTKFQKYWCVPCKMDNIEKIENKNACKRLKKQDFVFWGELEAAAEQGASEAEVRANVKAEARDRVMAKANLHVKGGLGDDTPVQLPNNRINSGSLFQMQLQANLPCSKVRQHNPPQPCWGTKLEVWCHNCEQFKIQCYNVISLKTTERKT